MTEYTIAQAMKITFQEEQKLDCSIVHHLTLFTGEGLEIQNRTCGSVLTAVRCLHLQILSGVLCFGDSHDTLMTE
jgi:hypothetical protein